jgi:hypothetical protein
MVMSAMPRRIAVVVATGGLALAFAAQRPLQQAPVLFQTADACMSCHNRLITPSGEDISIGYTWRASMMANAARDPYWHAAVRREILDYPESAASIENECSRCHMPMANEQAQAAGGTGEVFANLPVGQSAAPFALLAADGVSCTVCHQIEPDNFGERDSFTGGFLIDRTRPFEQRPIYGPYDVDTGRVTLMHSSSGFLPTQSTHVQQSEMCASCHMLYTHALSEGAAGRQMPEQTPYLEWLASGYRNERSCQSCHMPVVTEPTSIASVLGQPRDSVSRHIFIGGNFFMIRMLNRFRNELGVVALPQEMEAAAVRTEAHLQSSTARLALENVRHERGRIRAVVHVTNLAGHKLPTAYPSRRTWIEFTVRDAAGRVVFSSGALRPDGSIAGNDNDADPRRFEPHHMTVRSTDQVQIYESIMAAPDGAVTTGLLTAVDYLKDNRILPRGWDAAAADPDVAVHGAATGDPDFIGGADRVAYDVGVDAGGPFSVEAALWYQPIGFRWAQNLSEYDSFETNRFVRYYTSMSHASALVLARTSARVE